MTKTVPCDNVKQNDVHVIEAPEGENEKREKFIEEIMAKIFPNLMKTINPLIQEDE